jgi:hypothetical protein
LKYKTQILIASHGVRWGEPRTLLTSIMAEPHIAPGPISRARAPDHVPSSLPPFLNSNSTMDKKLPCLDGWLSFVSTIVIHDEKSCSSVIYIPCYALACSRRCNRCFCW